MQKKNFHSKDTTTLFVTKDTYSNAYFVRTEKEKFARFIRFNNEWVVWFYPFKYTRKFSTLTETLKIIERIYKKYWEEMYAVHNSERE